MRGEKTCGPEKYSVQFYWDGETECTPLQGLRQHEAKKTELGGKFKNIQENSVKFKRTSGKFRTNQEKSKKKE